MAKQLNFNKKEFCLRLLQSEMEDEVVAILKEYGYWDDRSVWKPTSAHVAPRSSSMTRMGMNCRGW